MFQANFTGTINSLPEIYDTGDGRQLHRFDVLAACDFIYRGDLIEQKVPIRVILTERLAYFADHLTRGRRILVQGSLITFRHTDAEGVDREKILVMAHFVELLDRPLTRKMAETVLKEEVLAFPALPILEEDLPF